MVSIPPIQPDQQEQLVTYRYVSRLTPERVKTLTPEQKEQALLEFLTLFNLILSVIYNPIAKEATRLLALDVIITQVQRTARKLIGTVTDKSPTYAAETEKRLGLSKNTISSGYKRLEKAGVLVRSHRIDETTRQEHLDIQPTPELFTRPEIIKDKKKRAAPKPHLDKSLDITKQCLECDSHNIRVTCRDCGSFIDVGNGEPHIMEATSDVVAADTTPIVPTHHKICDDIQNPITITKFVTTSESEVRENPITPPPNAEEILTTWLAKRIGEGQLIYATGKTEQQAKYITLPVGTKPNLKAYLKGDPRHIYGSRLATHITTSVLCFDLDDPEQDAQIETYLQQLTQAGAKPLYWHRQNNRGHLEIYFSEPVNTEAAYQWCVSVCPALASIPECYPARDKKANGLSWPLYQRVGKEVSACSVSYWTDRGLHTLPGVQTDPQSIAALVTVSVTPGELLPHLPPAPPADGGVLLEKSQDYRSANGKRDGAQDTGLTQVKSGSQTSSDLAQAVISEFNNSHTWEEVAAFCGGLDHNRFCAVWRGEDTPSVVIDRNGLYACDYGRIGESFPKKLDKYEVWVLSRGGLPFKRRDLAERIAAYRRQEPRQTRPEPQITLSEAEQNSQQQHAFQAVITVQVMAKPVTPCRAVTALNKEGKRAGAREEIVSYQECGATRWLWSASDQSYICVACLTPCSREGEECT